MNRIILCCIAAIFFSSCVERAYYVSPSYGNAMPYHTLPLRKDSIKSSLYINGSILTGGANDNLRDKQFAFNTNLYNANSFNWIKVWYGGGFTLGDYKVTPYDSAIGSESFSAYITNAAGGKFFGSLNENAGVALTIPIGKRSEWRILCVQETMQEEFGRYLSFRKQLAKNSVPVDGNTTSSFLSTVGFSTEFCFALNKGSFNWLQQLNVLTGKNYLYADRDDFDDPTSSPELYRYSYWSNVFAVNINQITGYMQANVGAHMSNVQFGLNYRLSKKRKIRAAD